MTDWEDMWQKDGGLKPGEKFDMKHSSPAFIHLMNEGNPPLLGRHGISDDNNDTQSLIALVPGCGRGYDVLELVERGIVTEAIGLEISPTAIQAAQELRESRKISSQKARFILADFYTFSNDQEILNENQKDSSSSSSSSFSSFSSLDLLNNQPKFDLIYDYTFLCAMQPEKRKDWAIRMKQLLKENGELVTLIFPVDTREGGPPFAVSPELVRELLEPHGFTAIYMERVPEHLSHEKRKGKEWLARWKLL